MLGLIKRPPPQPPPLSKLPPIGQLYVFGAMALGLAILLALQQAPRKGNSARWLPPVGNTLMGEKRSYEVWVLKYSVFWMATFAAIVVFQLYESFSATTYFVVCGGLAAPLILHEVLQGNQLRQRPWAARHGVRAQLWIAIFGFIGNYWYTHYFYCVLRARYTMPAWRLNDVPIAMYFATHFYFSSYHVFSNLVLRRVSTGFAPGRLRSALLLYVVCTLAYVTAFMETFTISHFPYYDFEDRDMAYTIGSAFYGLYFVVSFPVYFGLDEVGVSPLEGAGLAGVALSSLGSGMLVLFLLDLTRLAFTGTPLTIGGAIWKITP